MALSICSKIFSAVALLLAAFAPFSWQATSCFNRNTHDIPADHLFHKKTKPLILGHRGHPRKFQENTIEGMKSLVGLGADGFETDIYLTDYGQLVLFHDDNALKLTGVDKEIWKMTPDEIKNLKYRKSLTYGKMTYNYTQRLSVGLLEDLFKATNDTDLLMYLEMKPSRNVYNDFTKDTKRSVDTAKAVVNLVKKYGLEKKVFLASLDFRKALAAKQENPKLAVGSFYIESYWKKTSKWYSDFKSQLKSSFPGFQTCLDTQPNNSTLMDFLFQKGSIFKSINASFIDLQFSIYSNKKITNDAFKTFRDNYNPKISAGASTIYDMKLNPTETDATEEKVKYLIDNGAARLATDDVTRLRQKLGREKVNGSLPQAKNISSFVFLFPFLVVFFFMKKE